MILVILVTDSSRAAKTGCTNKGCSSRALCLLPRAEIGPAIKSLAAGRAEKKRARVCDNFFNSMGTAMGVVTTEEGKTIVPSPCSVSSRAHKPLFLFAHSGELRPAMHVAQVICRADGQGLSVSFHFEAFHLSCSSSSSTRCLSADDINNNLCASSDSLS